MSKPHEPLTKCQQVADDIVALTVAETKSRHQAARLNWLRVSHPTPEILGRVRDHPGSERLAVHQMCQVRCVGALRGRAAHPMAIDARLGKKRRSTGTDVGIFRGRLPLFLQPTL